jgi:uncharacterized membrane protein
MKIKSFIIDIISDILLLTGIGLLLFGIYIIYQPATFIIAGLILIIAFKPSFNTNKKQFRHINRKT